MVTWTHFYCNSSIESKKVLININTMPMLKSPLSTPPTPLFPPRGKKQKKRERKKEIKQKQKKRGAGTCWGADHNMKKATTWVFPYLQKEDFSIFPTTGFFFFVFFLLSKLFFHSFSYIGRTSLKNNAHTKDTHLHSIFFFLSPPPPNSFSFL